MDTTKNDWIIETYWVESVIYWASLQVASDDFLWNWICERYNNNDICEMFLEQFTASQLVKKPSALLELESSLLYSWQPTIRPYPQLIKSMKHIHAHTLLHVHCNIILPSIPRSTKSSHPYRFSEGNYVFLILMYVICLIHLTLFDLDILIISEEEWKSFFHS